ncbi:MAG: restriction endonuclease subunit S [bacterium]|nr:restriction endonuclease subunit S [bacterium]
MADDGFRTTLGDYFTLQRGTTYKSRLLGLPGPVLLGLATIQRNGGFRTDSLQTYGGDSPTKLLVQPGDLYLSLKNVTQSADLLGAVARLPIDHPPGRLTQDTVKLEPIGSAVPLDYLYWLLRTPQYRSYCRAHATGTTNLGLSREDFLGFSAPEPTPIQSKIVDTLSSLDDKIELNRRMNKTLETMAWSLFKSWFVDFAPVRAKAAGRDTGLPKSIADHFPDRLVDSELGEIPEGWEICRFGAVVEQLRDQENPLSSPNVLYHHFSIPSFDAGQTPKLEYGESIKSIKSRVPAGVVLLSKLNPEIDRVWLVDVEVSARAVCSTEFLVLRARAPFTRSYAYCLARSSAFRQQIEGLVTGTSKSHQRAQVASILDLGVVSAPADIVGAFSATAENLLARTLTCRRESRSLIALRDTLLPKLISGEMRISDAERFIERSDI